MPSNTESSSVADSFPLKGGALGGAIAFVAGYVLTYLLVAVDSELEGTQEDAAFELIGVIFYNAHFVDGVFVFASGTFLEGTRRFNVIAEETTQFPEPVFYLVPVVILILTGYLVVSQALPGAAVDSSGSVSTGERALAGSSVVVGYLPLAVAGTFLFETTSEIEILGETIRSTFGPDQLMAIVFVGLVFPVVLGAIGGVLARR